MSTLQNLLPSSFGSIFALLLCINLVAVKVNHIDDTDETYGYWEPLHYLLYGHGMQTWEYAKEYAIRTYSFILPFWVVGFVMNMITASKVAVFYGIRTLFATQNAFISAYLIESVRRTLGQRISTLLLVFLATSPGVFYASTSYLPSAVTMSLMMLAFACWLRDKFVLTIFWGCLAVLWTGWPFVGVILVPLGLHMLLSTAISAGLRGILRLCIAGALVLIFVAIPPVLIDSWFYGKMTSPSWNILVYNAIGGSGDELYGVEPASYYIRNLFLNLGVCLPLGVLGLASSAIAVVLPSPKDSTNFKALTIALCASLWLGILFSRPHKEERFMYPVYPLLCLLAALAASQLCDLLNIIENKIVSSNNKKEKDSNITVLVLWLVLVVSSALGTSRITSNYRNYRGVIDLWSDIGVALGATSPNAIGNNYHFSPMLIGLGLDSTSNTQDYVSKRIKICTAGEWYLFPNHFLLPSEYSIEFIEGNFHGLLPRHFPAPKRTASGVELGTSMETGNDFNDRNMEVRHRYENLDACDALVLVCDIVGENNEDAYGLLDYSMFVQVPAFLKKHNPNHKFLPVYSKPLLNVGKSSSSLLRAFYVPTLSQRANRYKGYTLLVNKNKR